MSFHIYISSGSGRYDFSYADSLSTNLFSVEADRNDRFADGAFNFDNALYCLRIRVKQPFIFTTWTSHMHFLHIFSPPARGQPKGNVKLTVGNCFIFLCTVCRDLNPMVAINIVYRTYVLLSINLSAHCCIQVSWRRYVFFQTGSFLFVNPSYPVLPGYTTAPDVGINLPFSGKKNKPGTTVSSLFQAFHPDIRCRFFTKVFYKVPDLLLSMLFWICLPRVWYPVRLKYGYIPPSRINSTRPAKLHKWNLYYSP